MATGNTNPAMSMSALQALAAAQGQTQPATGGLHGLPAGQTTVAPRAGQAMGAPPSAGDHLSFPQYQTRGFPGVPGDAYTQYMAGQGVMMAPGMEQNFFPHGPGGGITPAPASLGGAGSTPQPVVPPPSGAPPGSAPPPAAAPPPAPAPPAPPPGIQPPPGTPASALRQLDNGWWTAPDGSLYGSDGTLIQTGGNPTGSTGRTGGAVHNGAIGYAKGGLTSLKAGLHQLRQRPHTDYGRGGAVVDPYSGNKRDTVPALVDNGEFVFTKKAVRNAGGGNPAAGAAKMFKLMRSLEDIPSTTGAFVSKQRG